MAEQSRARLLPGAETPTFDRWAFRPLSELFEESELSPRVQEVLRELITTEGIGLLLPRNGVIHADPGYSITAKVTDKLNQQP